MSPQNAALRDQVMFSMLNATFRNFVRTDSYPRVLQKEFETRLRLTGAPLPATNCSVPCISRLCLHFGTMLSVTFLSLFITTSISQNIRAYLPVLRV